jgi:hypothetical protein
MRDWLAQSGLVNWLLNENSKGNYRFTKNYNISIHNLAFHHNGGVSLEHYYFMKSEACVPKIKEVDLWKERSVFEREQWRDILTGVTLTATQNFESNCIAGASVCLLQHTEYLFRDWKSAWAAHCVIMGIAATCEALYQNHGLRSSQKADSYGAKKFSATYVTGISFILLTTALMLSLMLS